MKLLIQGQLQDYITAIALAPRGSHLLGKAAPLAAIASAVGELTLLNLETHASVPLIGSPLIGSPGICTSTVKTSSATALNALAWSPDGAQLAIAGQAGRVEVWQISDHMERIATYPFARQWIEHLAWRPGAMQLAIAAGSEIYITSPSSAAAPPTPLDFGDSSILGLAWSPDGGAIAACGHRGAKVWPQEAGGSTAPQSLQPQHLQVSSASHHLAWSGDGQYLALANLDNSILVYDWRGDRADPWKMQGFGSKIRALAWCSSQTLAVASGDRVILWQRQGQGWAGEQIGQHDAVVEAIAVCPELADCPKALEGELEDDLDAPGSLAAISADGYLALWDIPSKSPSHIETGAFTAIHWIDRQRLLTGNSQGLWQLWQI